MTTVNEVEQKVTEQVDAAANEIQKLADELRVKVHLAGMEAKDAWSKLEPKLDDVKARAKTASKDTLDALNDVKNAFKTFAEKHKL